MIYLQIFGVFFVANILGYGGGPAIIPLIQHEVVNNFAWITDEKFIEVLAMGNALPGPIATKMAAYIGFYEAGVLGSIVALFATVAPSLILMIALMGILLKYKDAPQVKRLSKFVQPTIAVLMGLIIFTNIRVSFFDIGIVHLLILGSISLVCIAKFKVPPAFVVIGAMVYGAVLL